jgi:hypothetical protein
MTALTTAAAANLLQASLGVATLTAFSGSAKLRLTTTAPTAGSAGTELAGGGGYTTGGTAVTFSSTSTNSTTGPAATVTFTNSSGSTWTIVGAEIWDSAGSPVRWWYTSWNGQPLSIINGNSFTVSTAALTVQI